MVIKSFLLLRWWGMPGGDLGFKYVAGLICASVSSCLFLGRSGAGFIWVFITSSLKTDFLVSCSYVVSLELEAVR